MFGHQKRLPRQPRRRVAVLFLLASVLTLAGAVAALNWHHLVNGEAVMRVSFPEVSNQLLRADPAEAVRIRAMNHAMPFSPDRIVPAKPFLLLSATVGSQALSAVDCLTAAVYYEAGNEPLNGQRAVAQVVLNRVRHPAFPASVCAVVFEGSMRATGCQFTFTCDGSLMRAPSAAGWKRAQAVAIAALSGYVEPSVGYATIIMLTMFGPIGLPGWSNCIRLAHTSSTSGLGLLARQAHSQRNMQGWRFCRKAPPLALHYSFYLRRQGKPTRTPSRVNRQIEFSKSVDRMSESRHLIDRLSANLPLRSQAHCLKRAGS